MLQLRCGFLVILAILGLGQQSFAADAELHRLRAARRADQKSIQDNREKTGSPALFGLLVIPVDFSDARLGDSWDAAHELSPRLNPAGGETLHNYFAVASRGNLDLRITIAPVVSLSGSTRDYSDVGYNGYSRTRALATEALEAVRDLGLEFRSLDMDGPDGLPGSEDDDGQLDGVLILHAGIGQENDPVNGLVQALQFYLDEPVVAGGIQASFYAVASLHSGLGIWAHETGHLLGMEDRYDFTLHPVTGGGDVRSLGGLGRFSLMSSGAWGTGLGQGAALPDAYTSLQLGWCQADYLPLAYSEGDTLVPAAGRVSRIWTRGETGSEFYLLETRDPTRTAPFDAGLPAGQMLVYHVDETVPEGSWEIDGPDRWHLRVNLVEADNDRGLATGQDDGRAEDLFPGPLGVTEFGPLTAPSSWGFYGNSEVHLKGITSGDSLVTFTAAAAEEPAMVFTYSFGPGFPAPLELTVRSAGAPLVSLNCRLGVVGSPAWGQFPPGEDFIDFRLEEVSPAVWRPAVPLGFETEGDLPPGAETFFSFTFSGCGWTAPAEDRSWLWQDPLDPLDFHGDWTLDYGGTVETTTWHVWEGPPYLTGQNGPILAATGSQYATAEAWPQVNYENRAWVSLVSPELGPLARAVRIIHAIESEVLTPGDAMDGGRLVWIGPGGAVRTADPVDGWVARVLTGSNNPLGGSQVFADSLLTTSLGLPIWQIDVVSVPEEPGPWRLKLEFASNSVWRYKGWFIADLQVLEEAFEGSAFPAGWAPASGLSWQWPYADISVLNFIVQVQDGSGVIWSDVILQSPGMTVAAADLLAGLGAGSQARCVVRVVAQTDFGQIASRPVVVYPDGGYRQGVLLGAPRPNPARNQVQFSLEIPDGSAGELRIYDVRGRAVLVRNYPAGRHLVAWDGRDTRGVRVGAGTYFLRLEGSGPVTTRKVVLLH